MPTLEWCSYKRDVHIREMPTLEWCSYRDGFTGGCGGTHPPSPGQGGAGGVLFFMIKPKIIRDKIRFTNLSNNMMISEL